MGHMEATPRIAELLELSQKLELSQEPNVERAISAQLLAIIQETQDERDLREMYEEEKRRPTDVKTWLIKNGYCDTIDGEPIDLMNDAGRLVCPRDPVTGLYIVPAFLKRCGWCNQPIGRNRPGECTAYVHKD